MNFAILLAGGTGTRLGSHCPKQFLCVNNTPVFAYSLDTLLSVDGIAGIAVVCSKEWRQNFLDYIDQSGLVKPILFAEPGVTRQYSVYNALRAIEAEGLKPHKVVVHDAARPLVSAELVIGCLDLCSDSYGGTLPVVPVKDTVYASHDRQNIDALLDRSTLFAGQAPEAFLFDEYLEAHRCFDGPQLLAINGSSELAHLAGMKVRLIPGDPRNFKITDQSDLDRFKAIIGAPDLG